MTDQATMAGKAATRIALGGKEYTLRPYVVGVWAEMKAFLASLKGDPIKALCERLDSVPANQQPRWMKAAVEAAANQTPSDEEMLAFEKSLLGQAFHLWACLKGEHLAEFPTPHVVHALMIDEAERHGQSKLTEIMLKVHVGSGGEARKTPLAGARRLRQTGHRRTPGLRRLAGLLQVLRRLLPVDHRGGEQPADLRGLRVARGDRSDLAGIAAERQGRVPNGDFAEIRETTAETQGRRALVVFCASAVNPEPLGDIHGLRLG